MAVYYCTVRLTQYLAKLEGVHPNKLSCNLPQANVDLYQFASTVCLLTRTTA